MKRDDLIHARRRLQNQLNTLDDYSATLFACSDHPSSVDQIVRAISGMADDVEPILDLIQGNIDYIENRYSGNGYRYSQGDLDLKEN